MLCLQGDHNNECLQEGFGASSYIKPRIWGPVAWHGAGREALKFKRSFIPKSFLFTTYQGKLRVETLVPLYLTEHQHQERAPSWAEENESKNEGRKQSTPRVGLVPRDSHVTEPRQKRGNCPFFSSSSPYPSPHLQKKDVYKFFQKTIFFYSIWCPLLPLVYFLPWLPLILLLVLLFLNACHPTHARLLLMPLLT